MAARCRELGCFVTGFAADKRAGERHAEPGIERLIRVDCGVARREMVSRARVAQAGAGGLEPIEAARGTGEGKKTEQRDDDPREQKDTMLETRIKKHRLYIPSTHSALYQPGQARARGGVESSSCPDSISNSSAKAVCLCRHWQRRDPIRGSLRISQGGRLELQRPLIRIGQPRGESAPPSNNEIAASSRACCAISGCFGAETESGKGKKSRTENFGHDDVA
jgi:hypothetical protein